MHYLSTAITILIISEMSPSMASSNQLSLHMCMNNQTIAVQILLRELSDMSCQCQAGPSPDPLLREDYVHTPGVGSHKLHTLAHTWNKARGICHEENAHLAIINSKAEEAAMLEIFRREAKSIRNGNNKEQAFLGIHDFFKEGQWVTIFDESLYSTGYAEWSTSWWGTQPDNKDNNQNCGALILRGGLDDVHCHEKFAFFCELPITCSS